MAERKKTGFETYIADLEKIVKQMEDGDLPLEKAISLYEKGVGLVKKCDDQLCRAQLKISELKAVDTDE